MTDDVDRAEALVKKILGGTVIVSETPIFDEMVKEGRRPSGITEEEIDAARTPGGGWSKEQLAQWGVPWPPPKGWKRKLLAEHG